MIRSLCLIISCSALFTLSAQDGFRHMHYNLTLYGNPFGCDEISNSTALKDESLRTIMDYVDVDVLTVNEMRDQNFWADRLLDEVLNVDNELWDRAPLGAQFTTSSILNAFYYRSDKFSLVDDYVVNQDVNGGFLLRPVNFYTLYLLEDGEVPPNPVSLTFAVAHLAASDEDERADQTEAAMAYIEENNLVNVIFTGDLNMDNSNEEAFQNLIAHPSIPFFDPVSTLGQWSNNASVSDYHTQSTRFSDTNNGCFVGGGLDDRFDLTLIDQDVLDGSEGLLYVQGTYEVVGQSGNDYNQELQTFNNQVVPDDIAQALYEMSDHLPVLCEFERMVDVGLSHLDWQHWQLLQEQDGIWVTCNVAGEKHVEIYDMSGRAIYETSFSETRHYLHSIGLGAGQIYVVRMQAADGQAQHRLFAQ